MGDFQRTCMTLFVVIMAISIGFKAFAAGTPEATEFIPSSGISEYAFSDINSTLIDSYSEFESTSAAGDVFGLITIGLGAIMTMFSILVVGFVDSLIGYVVLLGYIAAVIEPSGGGVTIFLLGIGTMLSLMAIYGLFTIIRSVLVR